MIHKDKLTSVGITNMQMTTDTKEQYHSDKAVPTFEVVAYNWSVEIEGGLRLNFKTSLDVSEEHLLSFIAKAKEAYTKFKDDSTNIGQ